MENQRDFKILNGFILKIMAIVFMTIDHIGLFMANYENLEEIAGFLANLFIDGSKKELKEKLTKDNSPEAAIKKLQEDIDL